jgi:septal ring-binding cell division protein DamX
MRRGLALTGLTAAFCLAFAPVAQAAGTQTRTCPLPGGGDPDVVSLSGGGQNWTVTADESPGEASHAVAVAVVVTSNGQQTGATAAGGMSPASAHLTLAPGHHYTVNWVATFDFGIHPCASVLPGQSAFEIDT